MVIAISSRLRRRPPNTHSGRRLFLNPHLWLLGGLVALAAYLRLHNIAHTPYWYTDEGTHLDIVRHWLNGETRYLAVGQSILLFGRLPAFLWLLKQCVSLFGLDIVTLRMLTGTLGILSTTLLYIIAYQTTETKKSTHSLLFPTLTALLCAIYPQAVLYSRFGFSYNLLAPLLLFTLWGLFTYLEHQKKWGLHLAILAIGLGIVSDLWMIAILPAFCLILLYHNPRHLLYSLPLIALPFTLYILTMTIQNPSAFWADWQFTFSRVDSHSLIQQIQRIGQNITILFSQDSWFLLGFIGLWRLQPKTLRYLALLLVCCPLFMLGRTVPLYSLSAYYLIPLFPLMMLGMAQFILEATQWLQHEASLAITAFNHRWLQTQHPLSTHMANLIALAGITIFILTPLTFTTQQTISNIQTHFPTIIDPFLLNDMEARTVANFLNNQTNPQDIILASPTLAWLLDGQVADFQMAIAVQGKGTPHMPANMPADRFLFDPRLEHVRYAVVDNLIHNWAMVHLAEMPAMWSEIQTWQLIFSTPSIQVYKQTSPNQPTP